MSEARHVSLLGELAMWDPTDDRSPSSDDFEAAMDADPERFRLAIRALWSRVVERQVARPHAGALAVVTELFAPFRERWATDPHLSYAEAYLASLRAAFECGLAAAIAEPTEQSVITITGALRDAGKAHTKSDGGAAGVRAVIGQVLSLVDRDAAADEFAPLRSEPDADLVRSYYRDSGALTYYAEPELTPISHLAGREIVRSIAPVREVRTGARTGIAVSVDAAFFRIYAGWLYFYAQQLDDIDVNIFLCGEESEVEELVSDADAFAGALGRLNRSGTPRNVSVYRMPVPQFVTRPKTFYACARFFAADVMLERYPNVYLMDADLYLTDNPLEYFGAIRSVSFGVPATTGGARLSPWRRYAAGNIALNRGIRDTPMLTSLQGYAAHGLRHSGDWMLDQNALSYVIEQDDGRCFRALNEFGRPFATSRFMTTWEASYRRARRREGSPAKTEAGASR